MTDSAEPVEPLYSTPEMSAIFAPGAHVRNMLTFEAALAQAEAQAGIIPQAAAIAIAAACNPDLYTIPALYREAIQAGTPAIPLVRMLTAQVKGEAQKFVHWGATSQDVIDSALMLEMQAGLALLHQGLQTICEACAALAGQHRETLMIGRTLLQQALPITFGLKAAHWLALSSHALRSLRERRQHSLALQFGGATGTLASLGEQGIPVMNLLADALQLPAPVIPWHTDRGRIAEIASTLGLLAGAASKIAGDIVLLAQTEVGEVAEASAPGKGRSSAMPHKRNPVDATTTLTAARLAIGLVPVLISGMAQEHERAVGSWQAEWDALPALFRYTGCAIEHLRRSLSGLQIDATRMRANLDITHGLVMAEALTTALAPRTGRTSAFQRVQAACDRVVQEGLTLQQACLEDEQISSNISPEEIERALDPHHYLGSTRAFIDRALLAYHDLQIAEADTHHSA